MNQDDLAAFCERSLDDVYRYALRLTGGDAARTADLVQETYLALVRRSRERPDDAVDIGWLLVTCRHRFLDDLRRHARAERRLARAWEPAHQDAPAPSGIAEALGRLPTVQRIALILRHVDGLTVAEVATVLRRSEHATESILRSGRDELRRIYRNEEAKEANP